jgi:antirestriction protein
MFRVFITNLGKYTEGKLVGKWLDLPCNNINKELESIYIKANSQYEEAFISDYENNWNYEVGEYENIHRLNELSEKLEEIEEEGNKEWLLAYCSALGENLQDAIENQKYQDSCFYQNEKTIEVTRELFNEWLDTIEDKELKQTIKWHFDYEEYAQEKLTDRYYDTEYGCIYI